MAQGPLLSAAGMVRENIVYDKDGQAYIPASQRPDGTWRKARRVKEGYIPPDEIPVYQSRGRQMARETPQISTGLNYMDQDRFFHSAEDTQFTDTAEKPLTRAQKKNARKKQKKKDKKSTEFAFEIEEITTGFEELTVTEKEKTMSTEGASVTTEVAVSGPNTLPDTVHEDEDRERLKRERALRKKLKQIRDLEARIMSGEISKPDQDQQAKISKKAEIEAELQLLAQNS